MLAILVDASYMTEDEAAEGIWSGPGRWPSPLLPPDEPRPRQE